MDFWGYRIWAVYNKRYRLLSEIAHRHEQDLQFGSRHDQEAEAYLETAIDKQRDHADYYTRSLRLDPEMLCFEKPGMYYNRYLYPITFPAAMQRDSILAYLLNRRDRRNSSLQGYCRHRSEVLRVRGRLSDSGTDFKESTCHPKQPQPGPGRCSTHCRVPQRSMGESGRLAQC